MTILTRLLAAVAILAYAGLAQAQVGPQLTQTGTRTDAATGLFGPAGGATSCNSVNTSIANNTVTITPPAGNYVYIAGVYIDITSDATGTTTVATMSTTNITGGPFWSLATIIPTGTSGAFGNMRQISESYATPLKSRTAGTAVTFVPSAAGFTDTIVCTRVLAYFAP